MLVGMKSASSNFGDDVKIVMDGSGDKVENSVDLYGIRVTSEGKEWTSFHRYNDFVALKTTLGAEADVIAAAPFPGKCHWLWMTDSMKAERREGLEKWIQEVVVRASLIDFWKEPLNEFLKKDSKIGVYGKDRWLQLVSSVNENAQSTWAKTASNLQEWYDNGVARCKRDEKCKALRGKLKDMKSGVTEMAQKIRTKVELIKEGMKEVMALNSEAEKAQVDLQRIKDSAESNAHEVKVAEDKLTKAEEEASTKMKEVESLKKDVQELEQNAKATMETSTPWYPLSSKSLLRT